MLLMATLSENSKKEKEKLISTLEQDNQGAVEWFGMKEMIPDNCLRGKLSAVRVRVWVRVRVLGLRAILFKGSCPRT